MSDVEKVATALLKAWFPFIPWDFLGQYLPRVVAIANTLQQPNQLEFEFGQLRLEIAAQLAKVLNSETGGAP